MNWTGKIIGSVCGFLIAGPLGSLLGLLIGHAFDQGWVNSRLQTAFSQSHSKPGIYFNTLFQVMGYVAKSDGRVSEREIQQAKKIMSNMGLDDDLKREAVRLFNMGKAADFNLAVALLQVRQACRFQPMLLRSFLEKQWEVAAADSLIIHADKRAVLMHIAQHLGLEFRFTGGGQPHGQGYEGSYHQQWQRATQHRSDQLSLDEAYRLLGVSASSNDASVKQAYRRLMSKYHPDKLMARGESSDQIKQATHKTQQIKRAYEKIQKMRQE